VQHMQWGSWYSAVAMALSSIGIICTLLVVGTFLRYNDTPIVKASGRELSYLLLSGCLLCYLMTFLLLMKPSTVACCIQRVGIGLGFSVMYASLLIKTNRIARIFEAASSSARRPQFISPRSQLCIGACLVGVQLGCSALWLMLSPPGTRIQQPSRLEAILRCSIEEKSFLVSLLYNMILIVVCTYYAVRTRSIPENFNESKFIGFTMYTTCIILAGISAAVQICTLCVSISLSASVALACLFTRKLYVIYFHPEKNVRRLTLNSGATIGSTPPAAEAAAITSGSLDSSSTNRLPPQLYRCADKLTSWETTASVSSPVAAATKAAAAAADTADSVRRAEDDDSSSACDSIEMRNLQHSSGGNLADHQQEVDCLVNQEAFSCCSDDSDGFVF
uniref:G_PROTEIN_RECEP_F3_4 domain-containing protein n=1 Tax=Macrostomum lignano TaxID=282301 RepID=A0A1I8FEQ9_9PLAT